MPSDRLSDFVRRFRARFETLHPVKFQRTSLGGHWGDTGVVSRGGKLYLLVRIEKRLSVEAQLLVLAHELAHCLQWRVDGQEVERECDHDAEWGIAFARIWTAMMDNS
jgi:phage gp46-like protein